MSKNFYKLKSNKGFTLVEIIAVIAIIAVLAVGVIPSVSGYVEAAEETSDLVLASNIIDALQVGLLITDHGLPEDRIFEMIWTTSTSNDGRAYDSSIILRNPTERKSVFNDGKDGDDLAPVTGASGQYEALLTTVVDSLNGGDVEYLTISGGGMYGYVGEGKSELSKQSSLAVHINTSTGEVALAAPYGWVSKENVDDWLEIGLNVTPAP